MQASTSRLFLLATFATVIVLHAQPASPASLSFAPSATSRMYQWAPDTASPVSGDYLSAYTNANGNRQRSLIAFDLSAIPANATINSATLTLFANLDVGGAGVPKAGGNYQNRPMEMYRLTQAWVNGQTTWNQPHNGASWSGGSFVGTTGGVPYATNSTSPLDEGTPVTWDLTSLVNDWTSGLPNDGLLLKSYDGNYLHFYTVAPGFNGPSGSYAPFLKVDYSNVPEPAGLLLLPVVTAGLFRRSGRNKPSA